LFQELVSQNAGVADNNHNYGRAREKATQNFDKDIVVGGGGTNYCMKLKKIVSTLI
jgi:hypothetical protein